MPAYLLIIFAQNILGRMEAIIIQEDIIRSTEFSFLIFPEDAEVLILHKRIPEFASVNHAL